MAKFYSVTLRMAVLAQQAINRWTYFIPTGGGSSSALELLQLMGFIPTGSPLAFPTGTIGGIMQSILSAQLSFIEVEAVELYTPTDFYTAAYSPALTGGEVAGISSVTDAFGFFSTRVRTDVKRGFKRLAGVPADGYGGGSQVDPAFLGVLVTLAEAMSNVLTGATADYSPSVFQFQEYTTPRGNKAYRKYDDPSVQATHVAYPVDWAPYGEIRTQVSRQLRRGS